MKYITATEPPKFTNMQMAMAKRLGLNLSDLDPNDKRLRIDYPPLGYYSFSKAIREIAGKHQDIVSRGGGRNFYYISLSKSCNKLITMIRGLQQEAPQREGAKELRLMWGKELHKIWTDELKYTAGYWHLGWVELER